MINGLIMKRVPNLLGYAASTDGDIYTENTYKGWGPNRIVYQTGKWRKMAIKPDKTSGYRCVTVSPQIANSKKPKSYRVHTLILLTFVGPCPEGMECRHLNGDASDCSLDNLIWGTPLENADDKRKHDTHPRGEKNYRASKTDAEVKYIKELLRLGYRSATIARATGMSPQSICDIKKGRKWKHIK